MPKTQETTRIAVPDGTLEVFQNKVLAALADRMEEHPTPASAYQAEAAWKGLHPLPSGHVLRYDLSAPSHVASALWLTLRLRDLLSRPAHALPEGVYEKREVLARIGNELDRALQRAGVEVSRE